MLIYLTEEEYEQVNVAMSDRADMLQREMEMLGDHHTLESKILRDFMNVQSFRLRLLTIEPTSQTETQTHVKT